MAAITYAPNFQPPEYVDNVDRVQAGGPKGFNAQFQQLQAEFAAIATVVAQISAALDALAQGSVINPIPVNTANWSASAEFGSTPPGWYKDAFGIVHLIGAAKQSATGGSNPNLLGTLPPAASPSRVVYTIVHTFNGTYADIAINPNGQIDLIDPKPPAVKDYSFVSLECITYQQ